MKNPKVLSMVGRDCIEDILACGVNYLGSNYELMFQQAWSLNISENEKDTVGIRIQLDWGNVEKLAEEYCKVQIETIHYENSQKAYEKVKEILEKDQIVAFTLDSHWCEWTSLYQKENYHIYDHVVLASEIYENGDLYCIDAEPVNNGVRVPYQCFIEGNDGMVILFKKTGDGEKLDSIPVLLNRIVQHLEEKGQYGNSIESIQKLCTMLLEMKLEEESQGYEEKDYWNSDLFRKLLAIANGRKNVANVLELYSRKYSDETLHQIADKMYLVGEDWLSVRGELLKAEIVGYRERGKEKIMDIMEGIQKTEQEVYEQIKKHLNDGDNL